jgi:hypothetical protein
MYKKGLLYLIVLSVLVSTQIFSQPLLEENFDYGSADNSDITAVTTNWTRHSGTMGPAYVATGLSYDGYNLSSIGGAISHTFGSSGNNDGDVNRTFTDVTTTSNVYVSFLTKISAAKETADYFLHLGPAILATTFRGRVFVRSNGTGFSFGLSKSSSDRVDDNTILDFNTVYLVVLKFEFNTTATNDDQCVLYVYSSGVPSTEPGSPIVTIGPVGAEIDGDLADVGTIAIRQGGNTPTAITDGIKISTSWSDIALPVELTSFISTVKDDNVTLKWKTATELNNKGFEIYRNNVMIKFVAGFGTTSESNVYQYVDKNLSNGTYSYKLVQVDLNGMKETVGTTEAKVNKVPAEFSISQNYPNPFNPSTVIKFALPTDAKVSLKVYNILGVEVSTLVGNNLSAGIHEAKFNASNLNSGIYFYNITTRGVDGSVNSSTMKMMYLK